MDNITDFNNENIVNDLNLLIMNIPEDIPIMDKVRWLYMKTGMLFSYDYRIAADENFAFKELDFENNFISRYQTCKQISYIFNLMLNQIDPCVVANVIVRETGQNNLRVKHEANELLLPDGTKFILDLTLDLVNIQSGCRTTQFGYTSGLMGDYDIISQRECQEMDERLGLIRHGVYTDDLINKASENIKENDSLDLKIQKISSFMMSFKGYHEGKQYLNKLFSKMLKSYYKEFNLTYHHGHQDEMVTCYIIMDNGVEHWVIYNKTFGLVKTSKERINAMLKNGWKTNSTSLEKITDGGLRM